MFCNPVNFAIFLKFCLYYFGLLKWKKNLLWAEKKWDIDNRSLGQILLYYGYFAYYAYFAFSRHPPVFNFQEGCDVDHLKKSLQSSDTLNTTSCQFGLRYDNDDDSDAETTLGLGPFFLPNKRIGPRDPRRDDWIRPYVYYRLISD